MAASSSVDKVKIDRAKILGKGNFGIVFEGAWRETKVAVKRIPIENAVSSEREESALQNFNHENVIKLFYVEENDDFKIFVLEFCDASLEKLFLKEDDPNKYRGPMPPETEVLLQLAKGLAYIHEMGLVHRDIKPENVLIWVNPQTNQVLIKWADFGLSKKVNERGTFTMTGVRGTSNYLAPEILKLLDEISSVENEANKRGTVKSDVFAEGLVFGYFLSGGVHPFGSTSYEIGKNVRTKKRPILPESNKIRNIIQKMLEQEPMKRATSSGVVNLLEKEKNDRVKKNLSRMFDLVSKENSSLEDLRKQIQDGVDINAKDKNGSTPLLHFAKDKSGSDNLVEIVSFLIQHGANVNSLDRKGKNALLLWCGNREQHENKSFLAIINLFVKNGIHIHCKDKDGDNALIALCANYKNENLIDIIRLLIENGIDFNFKNEYGRNALILLCEYYKNENLIDIIRLLIENGIDVNCKDKDGDNALIKLCEYYENENFIDVIKFLIKSGLNVTEETCAFFKKNYHKKHRVEVLQLFHEILQQYPVEPATKRMKFE